MFTNENIIKYLDENPYDFAGFCAINEYIKVSKNEDYEVLRQVCINAVGICELIIFINRTFPELNLIKSEEWNNFLKLSVYWTLFMGVKKTVYIKSLLEYTDAQRHCLPIRKRNSKKK